MDNLTHSLVALTLAQTPLRRCGPGTVATLVLASNAPDSDIVVAITGGSGAYLSAHRGSSHGPLGVVTLAAVVAGLVYGVLRWRRFRQARALSDVSFPGLFALALVGTFVHVLMDLPTSYGTHSLSPFDRTWYTLDWIPIIDVYLLALLAVGIAATRMTTAHRTTVAWVVLALIMANYGLRARLHATALQHAAEGHAAITSGLGAWPDAPRPKLPNDFHCQLDRCRLAAAALPTFGSPFRWVILRQFTDGYQLSELDLLTDDETSIGWIAHEAGSAVEAARQTSSARTLLAFSRFPLARVEQTEGDTQVVFTDVRFRDTPVRQRSEGFRPGGLFIVRVRLDASGTRVEDHLGD